MKKRQLTISGYGPIFRNNNPLELAQYFIPKGYTLFSHLQTYESILYQREDSSSSQTGKSLIYLLPFLKAFGGTNQKIAEFSYVHISLLPGAKTFLKSIEHIPFFLISAFYEPFILSFCDLLGVNKSQVYCTKINLDGYPLNESEREIIKDLADEIVNMPLPSLSKGKNCLQGEYTLYLEKIGAILNGEIPQLQIGKIMNQISVQVGVEKIKALQDSLNKTGIDPQQVMYIGSNLFDAAAIDWIKKNGGVALSFNGDNEALFAAEIGVVSSNAIILAILSDIFFEQGKKGIFEFIENWELKNINSPKLIHYQSLINQLFSHGLQSFPQIEIVTDSNRQRLINESKSYHQFIFK